MTERQNAEGWYRFVGGPRDGNDVLRTDPVCAVTEYLVLKQGKPSIERYDVVGRNLVFRDSIQDIDAETVG